MIELTFSFLLHGIKTLFCILPELLDALDKLFVHHHLDLLESALHRALKHLNFSLTSFVTSVLIQVVASLLSSHHYHEESVWFFQAPAAIVHIEFDKLYVLCEEV